MYTTTAHFLYTTTTAMLKKGLIRACSKDLAWVTVPDTEVDFPLYDGSMFVLDTDDEEQR